MRTLNGIVAELAAEKIKEGKNIYFAGNQMSGIWIPLTTEKVDWIGCGFFATDKKLDFADEVEKRSLVSIEQISLFCDCRVFGTSDLVAFVPGTEISKRIETDEVKFSKMLEVDEGEFLSVFCLYDELEDVEDFSLETMIYPDPDSDKDE